jgi:alkylresorcinol/alkylpyrone synthase
VLEQAAVTAAAKARFAGRLRELERLLPVFENAGIERRQAARPLDWYLEARTWPERTQAYLDVADDLFAEAATRALEAAGLDGARVDVVVTVSSTGIATPSLEARAMGRLGLRADVRRVPVFGLGCAGGVTGLSLAARLAQASPGSVVLLVCIELCTAGEGLLGVDAAAEHTWPDTLSIMGWSVDEQGFGVIFDRSIPAFAAANLRAGMDAMLNSMGSAMDEVDRFVCHPGGTKVLEAIEGALDLSAGALALEREVLRDHGNMSAPTALFVLQRVLDSPARGRLVLTALGPGFTASCARLTV